MAFTRAQFKNLIRQVFKVKPGGPTDVTRAQPVINLLDKMVDEFAQLEEIPAADQFTPITEDQYGTHEPAATLDQALAYLYAQLANGTAVTVPARPTGGLVDDTGNTFSVLLVPGYDTLAEYQGFGFPGVAGTQPLTTANAYLAAGRVYLKNLTGPIEAGAVGIGVAASGNRPAGPFAINATAFTGPVVLPQPTITSFSPASAAAGAQVTLNGTNFTGATAVLFGTTPAASFTVLNATTLIAAVPAGAPAGALRLSVTTSSGTGVSAVDFTVVATAPVLPPHTLTGPSEGDLNGVTLTTDGGSYVLYYTRLDTVTNSDGKRMDLMLAGEICAAVDFPASHLTTNTAWAFTRNGQTFTGNFTDGTVILA